MCHGDACDNGVRAIYWLYLIVCKSSQYIQHKPRPVLYISYRYTADAERRTATTGRPIIFK